MTLFLNHLLKEVRNQGYHINNLSHMIIFKNTCFQIRYKYIHELGTKLMSSYIETRSEYF